MDTKKHMSYDESDNGKYIIVKISRKTLYGNIMDPSTLFSGQRKFRHTLRMIRYVVVFLIGLIVGSIFHDHILAINSDHATWKMFTTVTKIK
jgi:hypothetical protein